MERTIDSKENSTYKKLVSLKHGSYEDGLFLSEGKDMLEEAIKAGCLRTVILPIGSRMDVKGHDVIYLKESLYKSLSNYKSLPEVICVCERKEREIKGDRIIYLDGIQDPGNLGTIIRTALALSYDSIVFSYDCVSIYNSKVIQSTKGAIFHIPFARRDLREIEKEGYSIFLTTLDGEDMEKVPSLPKRSCLVFGNEGHGIRKEYLSLGKKLRIDMEKIDSLNVAVASAIFMYRYRRQG